MVASIYQHVETSFRHVIIAEECRGMLECKKSLVCVLLPGIRHLKHHEISQAIHKHCLPQKLPHPLWNKLHSVPSTISVLQDVNPRCTQIMQITHLRCCTHLLEHWAHRSQMIHQNEVPPKWKAPEPKKQPWEL